MTQRVLCIIGTRPEAIKLAPVILGLLRRNEVRVRVLATGQHRELLHEALGAFDIRPDLDLGVMQPDQSLAALSARLLTSLDGVLETETPDTILAQGDTTTVAMAALAAFYRNIPFGHVEAGLRTGNARAPFPEEMNRVLASRMAHWHFAPTARAADALRSEGIPKERIEITGNPGIDALLMTAERGTELQIPLDEQKRLILVTAHRRESFGPPLAETCRALHALVERNEEIEILYPVHPNPSVAFPVREMLGGLPRIVLCEPLEYGRFVTAMQRAHLILTDSGGIQEEAPALAKPVLVLRDETERPEAVEAGVARLVGTGFEQIVKQTERLLSDADAYAEMARGASPYGDGKAASRIVEALLR